MVEVVEANNGTQAMEKLRTTLPDLILLDVMMPDIDGFTVLKMVREIETSVIMLTAKVRRMNRSRSRIRRRRLCDQTVQSPRLTSRIRAVLDRAISTRMRESGQIVVDDRLALILA